MDMDTIRWKTPFRFLFDRAGFRSLLVCSFILCRKLARCFTSYFKSISPLENLCFFGQVSGVFLYAYSFYAGNLPQSFFYTYLLLYLFFFYTNNNNNINRVREIVQKIGGGLVLKEICLST